MGRSVGSGPGLRYNDRLSLYPELTMTTPLTTALQSANMLLIDNLHAFDFTADTTGLRIECMDGRDLKRWDFSAEQVAAATLNDATHEWSISGDKGDHLLVCVQAFGGQDEDQDEPAEQE